MSLTVLRIINLVTCTITQFYKLTLFIHDSVAFLSGRISYYGIFYYAIIIIKIRRLFCIIIFYCIVVFIVDDK
jgi:hypothetical protein